MAFAERPSAAEFSERSTHACSNQAVGFDDGDAEKGAVTHVTQPPHGPNLSCQAAKFNRCNPTARTYAAVVTYGANRDLTNKSRLPTG